MPLAKQQLTVSGVVAHNPGDYVPAENVEPNGWADMVEDSPELDQKYQDLANATQVSFEDADVPLQAPSEPVQPKQSAAPAQPAAAPSKAQG